MDSDDLRRARIERATRNLERPDRTAHGAPAMLGYVTTPTGLLGVGKYFLANPVTVMGEEVEGGSPVLTTDTGVSLPVVAINQAPAAGGMALASRVEHRWEAATSSGKPPCGTPRTVTVTITACGVGLVLPTVTVRDSTGAVASTGTATANGQFQAKYTFTMAYSLAASTVTVSNMLGLSDKTVSVNWPCTITAPQVTIFPDFAPGYACFTVPYQPTFPGPTTSYSFPAPTSLSLALGGRSIAVTHYDATLLNGSNSALWYGCGGAFPVIGRAPAACNGADISFNLSVVCWFYETGVDGANLAVCTDSGSVVHLTSQDLCSSHAAGPTGSGYLTLGTADSFQLSPFRASFRVTTIPPADQIAATGSLAVLTE